MFIRIMIFLSYNICIRIWYDIVFIQLIELGVGFSLIVYVKLLISPDMFFIIYQ